METQVDPGAAAAPPAHSRRAALAHRGFRRYFLGYSASLLGSGMAGTATVFAFLNTGRGANLLGLVLALGIVPILLCLPVAGVVADRLGCRRVILFADGLRCANRAGLAATLLLVHRPPVWVFALFIFVEGAGDGFFYPAFSALIPRLVDDEVLTPANVLMSMARSGSAVIGPSVSGVLVAAFGAPLVFGLDATSFAASFIALLGIPVAVPACADGPKRFRTDLREGWSVFAAHPWYWMQTLQFTLFNFMVWAPFLVLGPTLSSLHYGGARAWGITMGCYGLGSIIGGSLLLRGREPRSPLFVGIVCTASYALAPAGFALRLPLAAIAVLMAACGAGTSISGALYATVSQRALPADALARASSYNGLGAFALGPLGLALAGPIGGAVGYTTLLGFGAIYQFVSVALLLAIPAGRRLPDPGQTTRGSR
jgi:MFS family permease